MLEPGMETQQSESAPANPSSPVETASVEAVNTGRWLKGKGILVVLALVALVGAAYWPSFGGGFVWDDLVLVKKNPLTSGELNWVTVWGKTDFSLSTVVLWWEWLGFGENARGYRIVNALLHAASALLCWRLLLRLQLPGAWIGAALFAVHPVTAASVAWISELKNTLSLPFFLVSALAYLAFLETPKTQSRVRISGIYAAALFAFLLALLAKTSAVVLPGLLLILLWWRQRLSRKAVMSLVPFFGMGLFFGLLTVWFQSQHAIRDVVVQTGNLPERLADAATAIWFYLSKAIWPVNLCAIYPSWNQLLPGAMRYAPLGLLVGAMSVVWYYRATMGRSIWFVLLAFAVALFPAWGLFDMYFMVFSRVSDHFAYLPLLILTTAAGVKLGQIEGQRLRHGLTLLGLAGLLMLTRNRAQVYATDEALWRDTVQKNPMAWNAHNNLACNLAEQGKLDAAIDHFQKSLAINPQNAAAQLNLARALGLGGQFDRAEPHFKQALELKPDDIETMTAYAEALLQNRRLRAAEMLFRKAVELKPTAKNRAQLAATLTATGQFNAAMYEYRKVLELEPDSVEALNNLAWLLASAPNKTLRNGTEAVRLAQEACRLTRFQQPAALGTLAAAQAEAGSFTNAVLTAQAAIDLSQMTGNAAFANRMEQLKRLFQSNRAIPVSSRP